MTQHREQQAEEASADFPAQEFGWLREAGLLSITLPDEPLAFGQRNTAQQLALLRLVGKGNLSVGRIYEGHINALSLIHLFGTDSATGAVVRRCPARTTSVWCVEHAGARRHHHRSAG